MIHSTFTVAGDYPTTGSYKLTLINGGVMPLSPPLVYSNSYPSYPEIGQEASEGLVQLCQTGDNSKRKEELGRENGVDVLAQGDKVLLPGQSITFEFHTKHKNIYVETMYGKTKDLCGVVSFKNLKNLKLFQYSRISANDRVIRTGKFSAPYLMKNEVRCNDESSAVSCLRSLSADSSGTIQYFSGYLPSILNFLELKYGGEEVLSLQVPTAGTIEANLLAY